MDKSFDALSLELSERKVFKSRTYVARQYATNKSGVFNNPKNYSLLCKFNSSHRHSDVSKCGKLAFEGMGIQQALNRIVKKNSREKAKQIVTDPSTPLKRDQGSVIKVKTRVLNLSKYNIPSAKGSFVNTSSAKKMSG